MTRFRTVVMVVAGLAAARGPAATPVVAWRDGAMVDRWEIAGPWRAEPPRAEPDAAVRSLFDRDLLGPDGGEVAASTPAGLSRSGTGWRQAGGETLDLAGGPFPDTRAVAYARVAIDVPAAGTRWLGVGSDDAVKVWVNGRLVHEAWVFRLHAPGQDPVPVRFTAGRNVVLLKILNDGGEWLGSVRMSTRGDALRGAARNGDADLAVRLLDEGVPPDDADERGWTALHEAAAWSRTGAAAILLNRGATVDPRNRAGLTPWHLARRAGRTAVAAWFAARGADPGRRWPDRGAQVDELMSRLIRPQGPGAAIAVAEHGEPVLLRGYGQARLDPDVPMTGSTGMYPGSIGKQFTAMVVLKLSAEGRLNLSDSIRTILPELPDSFAPVTVRHLLTHTGGLPDLMADWSGRSIATAAGVLEEVGHRAVPRRTPGAAYRYSSLNYVLLEIIAARTGGAAYGDLVRRWVFDPAGMKESSTRFRGDETPARTARGYVASPGGWTWDGNDYRRYHGDWDGSPCLTISAGDYLRYDRAVFGGRVIPVGLLTEALNPVRLPGGRSTEYGYAWSRWEHRGIPVAGHTGIYHNFRSSYQHYLGPELTVVVLANSPEADTARWSARIAEVWLHDRMAAVD